MPVRLTVRQAGSHEFEVEYRRQGQLEWCGRVRLPPWLAQELRGPVVGEEAIATAAARIAVEEFVAVGLQCPFELDLDTLTAVDLALVPRLRAALHGEPA